MLKASVIIVSYNTRELTLRCIRSLAHEPVHEVIIVDNASADGSVDAIAREFPTAKLIRNQINRGFGAANNQGLDLLTGDLAFLLNSDIEVHTGSIRALVEFMSTHPDAVGVGGALIGSDGIPQKSAANPLTLWAIFCEQTLLEKLLPRSRIFAPYWLAAGGEQPVECAQVMGACFLFKPKERFDENFFLYCEDTELCVRLKRHGSIWYYPAAKFTHELGASSSAERWLSVARYNRGKELTMAIHRGTVASVLAWCLNRFGAFIRLLGWSVITVVSIGKRGKAQPRLWWRVLTTHPKGPPRPDGKPR